MLAEQTRTEDEFYEGADGRRMFSRRWLPAGPARAAIVIVHGYAEHSGRYDYVGRWLAGRGFAVHALDLRGHGQSDGPRAIVRSMNEFLEDLRGFFALVRGREPGRPLFLLGHSMGGAVVTLACITGDARVDGVLLSGAVLPAEDGDGGMMAKVITLVGRFLPKLPIGKLKGADVSRDPEIVRLYDADPLNYRGRIKAGLAASMIRAVRHINRESSSISTPICIMHGTADALTKPDGSRRLYARIVSGDKTLKLYDGLYHEILNEPERDQVLTDIAAWMDARLPGGVGGTSV